MLKVSDLSDGDTIIIYPTYEESLGGQIFPLTKGNISIKDKSIYLDGEPLSKSELQRVVKYNTKEY